MIYDRDSVTAHVCELCGLPSEWLSLYTGPRCDRHRPEFDAAVVSLLTRRGLYGTAAAYHRVFAPRKRDTCPRPHDHPAPRS